jgi:putative membrane protein insertion efficiency factor
MKPAGSAPPPPAPPPRRRLGLRLAGGLLAFLLLESLLPAPAQPASWVAIAALRAYQAALSPLLQSAGARCRYRPSYSDYAVEAYARHGTLRGTGLTLARLWRCSPAGGTGYDPVD